MFRGFCSGDNISKSGKNIRLRELNISNSGKNIRVGGANISNGVSTRLSPPGTNHIA